MSFTVPLCVLTIVLVPAAALICMNYHKANHILRLVCKDLIDLEARGRKVCLTPDEVEKELDEWTNAVEKREFL